MQDIYWKELEFCLSPERLAAFGQDEPGHRIVTARCLWNVAISEALYAPLHLLEVGLRNSIHEAMAGLTGTGTWYDSVTLTPWGYRQVGKAKNSVARSGKSVVPGRVVAELHFGFWTSMFESDLERPGGRFLPAGIKHTFPHMPKSRHHRKDIKSDLDRIRTLRNRVFHYERVIHWKDLPSQHQLILDFLGWINPDLLELAMLVDRFDDAHAKGIQPFLDRLDHHWSGTSATDV